MWDGGHGHTVSGYPTQGGSDGHHDRARQANGRRTGRSLERAIRGLVRRGLAGGLHAAALRGRPLGARGGRRHAPARRRLRGRTRARHGCGARRHGFRRRRGRRHDRDRAPARSGRPHRAGRPRGSPVRRSQLRRRLRLQQLPVRRDSGGGAARGTTRPAPGRPPGRRDLGAAGDVRPGRPHRRRRPPAAPAAARRAGPVRALGRGSTRGAARRRRLRAAGNARRGLSLRLRERRRGPARDDLGRPLRARGAPCRRGGDARRPAGIRRALPSGRTAATGSPTPSASRWRRVRRAERGPAHIGVRHANCVPDPDVCSCRPRPAISPPGGRRARSRPPRLPSSRPRAGGVRASRARAGGRR